MADDVLQMPLQYLKGVGPRKAADLKKAGLNTVEDLLFRFPRRYEDRSRLQNIISLKPGQTAAISGVVLNAGLAHTRRPGVPAVLGVDPGRQRPGAGSLAEPGLPERRHSIAASGSCCSARWRSGARAGCRSPIRSLRSSRTMSDGLRDAGRRRAGHAPHRAHRAGVRAHRQRDAEHAAPLRLAGARTVAARAVRPGARRHPRRAAMAVAT